MITPNPFAHSLLADKCNLSALSDPATLQGWGLGAVDAALLKKGIPHTVLVTTDNLLLAAARLYQGQVTNSRSPGGGFPPLFVLKAGVTNQQAVESYGDC